jgi:hypothetical protein
MADTDVATADHRLARPTLADARTALERMYGPHLDDVWSSLLARTGLTGAEQDSTSFDRLVNAMCSGEPVTRICGRSLAMRAATHKRLTAAEGKPG